MMHILTVARDNYLIRLQHDDPHYCTRTPITSRYSRQLGIPNLILATELSSVY